MSALFSDAPISMNLMNFFLKKTDYMYAKSNGDDILTNEMFTMIL